jgi:hypothetical protein
MRVKIKHAGLARHAAARHAAALALARWRVPDEAVVPEPMPQAHWLELTQERYLAWLRRGGFAACATSDAQTIAEPETKTAAQGRRFPVPSRDSCEEL